MYKQVSRKRKYLNKMNFNFRGIIPASKSIMNRALICSSYSQNLKLEGTSSCDDVVKMVHAIHQLQNEPPNLLQEFDCGAAGTVLRFLALRLSRIPGKHILKGSERLFQRPQKDLLDLFNKLGVHYELSNDLMILHSEGWKNLSQPLEVHRNVSSQFASGIILNAWDLNQDLNMKMIGPPMSEGYLQMTVQLVKALGMKISFSENKLVIPAKSQVEAKSYQSESDLSSLFAVAAFSVLNGEALFEKFPFPSLQPDIEFLDFFNRMEIPLHLNENEKVLNVFPVKHFKGLDANLNSCPDLFPVLAVLCAFASTPSKLFGAPQLVHKESNRIAKIADLLNAINVENTPLTDGMIIQPAKKNKSNILPFEYDTDHDHRLAFAASLILSQGFPIKIKHPEVVNKSFPEFWQVINLSC